MVASRQRARLRRLSMTMRIESGTLVLRAFSLADAEALVPLANDRSVWRNMRDAFPHPYALEHAKAFIEHVAKPGYVFAIEHQGHLAGACGIHPFSDVYAHGAEIGYWLGAPFHGKGLATLALGALTRHGFEDLGLKRLKAAVYEWNPASARVLEKNGYVREAVMKRSVFKDGQLIDAWLYAKLA